jgi:hypothetical protein
MLIANTIANRIFCIKLIQGRTREKFMNDLLRGGLAGAAAWKFGGGLISTILIFLLIFWLLGKF